jgi:trans-aconitate methyltransferase
MNQIGSVFEEYSRYYDLLYLDKDYESETKYITQLMSRNGIFDGEILEFGSGTGKHGRLLSDAGFKVHGIELSHDMVEKASVTPGFSCQQGDIRSIQMNRTYSAVLALFHVVSYQAKNADVQMVFSRASEHLDSGGLFIFDFWYTPAVYAMKPSVRIKRFSDTNLEITRIAEPEVKCNENVVDVNYSIVANSDGVFSSVKETHQMRHFSLPEIDFISQITGFERVHSEEFLTGRETGENTWGVCVVLRKM